MNKQMTLDDYPEVWRSSEDDEPMLPDHCPWCGNALTQDDWNQGECEACGATMLA